MKIENTVNTAASLSSGASAARTGQKSTQQTASEGVQMSAQLQSINQNLASSEAFDAERVETIRQAISEGRFTVNPEKVADRLLESVRELMQRRG